MGDGAGDRERRRRDPFNLAGLRRPSDGSEAAAGVAEMGLLGGLAAALARGVLAMTMRWRERRRTRT